MAFNIIEDFEGRIELLVEGEMFRIFKVWLTVFTSMFYCYYVGKVTEKGRVRFICVLPVVGLFLFLPLNLYAAHSAGITGFFIAWLATFKLLLFAFGKGPLCDHFLSLGRFVAVGCFPIKIVSNQNIPVSKEENYLISDEKVLSPPPESVSPDENTENMVSKPVFNDENREKRSSNGKNEETTQHQLSYSNEKKWNPNCKVANRRHKSLGSYAVKCLLFAIILHPKLNEYLHPKLILVLYCIHIYFSLEIILAVVGALIGALLGMELEPHFDDPYLSTSLQDFWGRRWNLMVTAILRPTVYLPSISFAMRFMSRRWAYPIAVMSTFMVSGIMHELIFFYLGHARPTWEITFFFILHGVCLVVENFMRKDVMPILMSRGCHIPTMVSRVLTLGIVIFTSFWLFFPQLLRARVKDRASLEFIAVGAFFKNVGKGLITHKPFSTSSG